jgi:aminoglycoside phosphotransferase (APT) family kinase protein
MEQHDLRRPAMSNMPAPDVHVDERLVRRLLASQFPEWASLRISRSPLIGWDNVIYRLGPDLLLRLPRRRIGAVMVDKQHRWLPELAPHLPLAVPVPVGKGVPGEGYPWRWSVCPWIAGEIAALANISDVRALAGALGAFVAALGSPGPADGPRPSFRGGTLASRDDQTRELLDRLRDFVDVAAATRLWEDALAVPAWSEPGVWLHGDLHAGNLLVEGGTLSGVIDFDHLAVGDPAGDLVAAWMLLPPDARPEFRNAAGVDDPTWIRGRAWALDLGLVMVAKSADNPIVAHLGRGAIDAVLGDRE